MRKIAIVREGNSDFLLIKKFVQCIFEYHRNEPLGEDTFIELDTLSIVNPLSKYIRAVSQTKNYSYFTEDANELIRSLHSVFFSACKNIERQYSAPTYREIFIIHADSEKTIGERKFYFDEWAYAISGVMKFSIDRFYEKMVEIGYSIDNIPYFVPLVFFPSTEILLASCMFDMNGEKIRRLKARPDLKYKTYSTENVPDAIETGVLDSRLYDHMIAEKLTQVYQEVPEIRSFMHSLIL